MPIVIPVDQLPSDIHRFENIEIDGVVVLNDEDAVLAHRKFGSRIVGTAKDGYFDMTGNTEGTHVANEREVGAVVAVETARADGRLPAAGKIHANVRSRGDVVDRIHINRSEQDIGGIGSPHEQIVVAVTIEVANHLAAGQPSIFLASFETKGAPDVEVVVAVQVRALRRRNHRHAR